MSQKIQKKIVLCLVFLLAAVTFSACGGTAVEEPEEIYFGIRFTQHKSEIQNVRQIVCGPDYAWAITSVKNAPIYQLEYGETAGVTELEWQQEANESLVNIVEQDGTLYADIWSGEENALIIRKYTAGIYWSNLTKIENVDDSWKNIGEGFFVDSSENVYLAGETAVTCFRADGQTQSTEYKLGGRPFFFQETESGSVECLMNGQNKLTLYTLTEDGAEKKWSLETALSGNAYGIRSSEEGTLCVAAGKEILFLDGSSGTLLTQPVLLSSIGVPSVLAGVYDAQEKALRLYSNEENSLSCRMLEGLDSPDNQRMELVYGTYGYGGNLDGYQKIIEAIVKFNQENEKYYITTKNYGLEDGREKLQLDMAAGNAPDIIDLRDLDYYESYVRNGYLEDLRPHIEQSGLNDDLLWNVLDLFKEDGGLYLMPPKLMLYCILLNPELEPVLMEDWNMETFVELIEKNQWEKDIIMDDGDPLSLLKFLTVCRQEEFLDFDRKEAHFETAEFLDMLALCLEYAGHDWNTESAGSQIRNNLFYKGALFGFDSYPTYMNIYGREYPVYGYPTSSGSSYPIGVYFDCCGIYAGSEQKEGAWEFIESLLEEDYQILSRGAQGFSVRKSYSETMAEKAKEIDFMVNGEVVYINDNEISILKDIIYGDHFFRGWIRNDIWNVIEEESAAYFAGDKSAKDVAHIIQSRVEIILNE